ncbi:hypothetical protein HUG10_08705 [Halorarum halophilum]|uniref:Uncharacterized protein n=1 Tax=Halorarum halophilum TaxID=2743090 RepID=A0A7D5GKX9_9EURY|nr:hypothetical protein [Halobaculum halophilum]QLG27627.1 hypothetical protein HUG10_08705 [Halobaculum halophilum]
MWARERDVVDYAVVSAVTLLLYLQLPFRPEIRETLRWTATELQLRIEESPEAVVAAFIIFVALFGGAFVLGMVRHASQ